MTLPDRHDDKRDVPASPLRFGGRRNSRIGGWRSIYYRVTEREHRFWPTFRPWVVEMDYLCDTFADRAVVCSRHRSVEEANLAASEAWAKVEADHAQAGQEGEGE